MKTLIMINDNIILWGLFLSFIVIAKIYINNYIRQRKFNKQRKQSILKKSIEATDKKTYTEKDLRSFGTYILSEQRKKSLGEKANKINNTDINNWKRKEIEQIIVNDYND